MIECVSTDPSSKWNGFHSDLAHWEGWGSEAYASASGASIGLCESPVDDTSISSSEQYKKIWPSDGQNRYGLFKGSPWLHGGGDLYCVRHLIEEVTVEGDVA